jgi:hypothetical protein
MTDKETLYVLYKHEYNEFISNILSSRRLAHETLNHFLITRNADGWESFYASLCEYIAIIHHFEDILERASLCEDWSEEEQCWYLEEKLAASLGIFAASEISCRQELLIHNVSLLLH